MAHKKGWKAKDHPRIVREKAWAALPGSIKVPGIYEMRENEIEGKLVEEVKRMGGICPKWVSPGLDGVPDRIVLLPGCRIGFVELKAPGRKMRPLQKKRKEKLEALGFLVFCIDDKELIEEVLREIQRS